MFTVCIDTRLLKLETFEYRAAEDEQHRAAKLAHIELLIPCTGSLCIIEKKT